MNLKLLPVALLAFSLPSCIGVSVGTDDEEFFRVRGLGTAYAALPGIDDYDGKIVKVGLLTRSPGGGQLAGVEIWPLLKVGVGFVGAQVRVLPLELGAGVLFYSPSPVRRDLSKKDDDRKGATVEIDMSDKDKSAKSESNTVTPAGDDVPIRPVTPTKPKDNKPEKD